LCISGHSFQNSENIHVSEFLSAAERTAAEDLQGVGMKMKSFLAVLALAVVVAVPARAQRPTPEWGGCEDSPENPTLILAGLAGGAFAINTLRLRLKARRASSSADQK